MRVVCVDPRWNWTETEVSASPSPHKQHNELWQWLVPMALAPVFALPNSGLFFPLVGNLARGSVPRWSSLVLNRYAGHRTIHYLGRPWTFDLPKAGRVRREKRRGEVEVGVEKRREIVREKLELILFLFPALIGFGPAAVHMSLDHWTIGPVDQWD